MKKTFALLLSLALFAYSFAQGGGWPANYKGVMLQGFYWDSYKDSRWTSLTSQAGELSKYFKLIWVPNSGNCKSATSMGYDPIFYFDHNSSFGTQAELVEMIRAYGALGTGIIEDVVINHKRGDKSHMDLATETWGGRTISWTTADVCRNDDYQGAENRPTGADDTGDGFGGFPDLDHTSPNVQANVKTYLGFLLGEIGYAGFRYDMVKGYAPAYTKLYNEHAQPEYSVGEYWDGSYDAVAGWINATGKTSAAFDFPLKYRINEAFGSGDFSKLSNKGIAGDAGPGGMSRWAVTFVDNHDTYRDGNRLINRVLPANAFILAMPGTPCVFLRHWQSYKKHIGNMALARNAAGITNQSTITKQQTWGQGNEGYVIETQGTDGKVLALLGKVEGYDTAGFKLIAEGLDFKFYVSENVTVEGLDTADYRHDITVYAQAAAQPRIYAWDAGGNLSAAWPGDLMESATVEGREGTWWKKTYRAENMNIIFNNGASGNGNQTGDIGDVAEDKWFTYGGGSEFTDMTEVFAGASVPDFAVRRTGTYCYFEADASYPSPHIWAWDGSGNFYSAFPGAELSQAVGTAPNGNKVYLWTSDNRTPGNIIFSSRHEEAGRLQTANLVFVNGGYYTKDGLAGLALGTEQQEARATMALRGVGYPKEGCAAYNALVEATYSPGATPSSIAAAVAAYKNSTADIQLPEEGKAYTFTSVQPGGTERYLDLPGAGGLEIKDMPTDGVLPATAKFVCHKVGDRFMFATHTGKYLVFRGSNAGTNGNKGYVDAYSSDFCPLSISRMADNTAASTSSASSNADLFGMCMVSGKRQNDSRAGVFVIKAAGGFDQADAQFYNTGFSSAFRIEETPYYNKVETNAAAGRNWASVYLPFATTVPEWVRIYTGTPDETEDSFRLAEIPGGILPARTAAVVTSETPGPVVFAPSEEPGTPIGGNPLKGTMEEGTPVNGALQTAVLNASGGVPGFYRYNGAVLPVGKAYMEISPAAAAKGLAFSFGLPTGIAEAAAEGNTGRVYDLQGRRVAKTVPGRIYVDGSGRKFYVK